MVACSTYTSLAQGLDANHLRVLGFVAADLTVSSMQSAGFKESDAGGRVLGHREEDQTQWQ